MSCRVHWHANKAAHDNTPHQGRLQQERKRQSTSIRTSQTMQHPIVLRPRSEGVMEEEEEEAAVEEAVVVA